MSDVKDSSIVKNLKYQMAMYPRRQCRDCVSGTQIIKRSNLMYLPMPSAWLSLDTQSSLQVATNPVGVNKMIPDYIPWRHPNPAYSAYLQRARFPDITASTLRGMLGIALKSDAKLNLPTAMEYLEDTISPDGMSLEEFFAYCLSEVMTVGNISIVVDIDDNDEFFLTTYNAESLIEWKTKRKFGTEIIKCATFVESCEDDYATGDKDIISYELDDLGKVTCTKTEDNIEGEPEELSYRGKPYTKIPLFCAGSVENSPDPQIIPLMGITDIAISIYQESADLRQAHFLTCNPTLFVFGVGAKETPKVIGSTVIVGISNPQGKAEYPNTDTSALDHIKEYIADLFKEAASYGANFIASGAKESGESLGIRKAGQGASLVQAVKNVGKAIDQALQFIAEMKGIKNDERMFTPNTEFAEVTFTHQDLTALVAAWMSGAIDQDIVLDNIRSGGYLKDERTNEEIISAISIEKPKVDPQAGNPKDDLPEEDDEKKETETGDK